MLKSLDQFENSKLVFKETIRYLSCFPVSEMRSSKLTTITLGVSGKSMMELLKKICREIVGRIPKIVAYQLEEFQNDSLNNLGYTSYIFGGLGGVR